MSFTCFNTSVNEPLTAIHKNPAKKAGFGCPKIMDAKCLACALILLNNVAFAAETVSKNDSNKSDPCSCIGPFAVLFYVFLCFLLNNNLEILSYYLE